MLHGLPLPVSVEQGAVTIVYSADEEIIFSGTNTDGATTYLFVTGPGLAANGVRLDDVAIPGVTKDAGTFTRVEVELGDTWEYRWDTGTCGLPPGGGTYTIYAVATPNARDDLADAVYGTASVTLRGEPGPTAGFTANTTAGPAPLTVRFTDASTGEITARSWSFGDGNTSSERNPVHTYRAPGNYTVNLTVSTGSSSDTLSRPGYITVTVKGDFGGDGEVDIGDVSRVAYMVVGKTAADPAADFNGNGAVDIGDAAKIAYYFVEKIEAL